MSNSESRAAAINVTDSGIVADEKSTTSTGLLKQYYELTKPGITQMVVLTTLAGFYLAVQSDLVTFASSSANWYLFLATIIGTVAISAGSCVFNHVMERGEDALMKRTASRPLPAGIISVRDAVIFGTILSVLGASLLLTVNVLTFSLAVATWLTYVLVYTPLKKKTKIALLIGGVPGALPFAGGWTAVSGSLDMGAIVLFAILFFWQLPHFLALSWMYRTDYEAGGFAMDSIEDSTGKRVGVQMVITSLLTLGSALMLTVVGVTGWLFFVVAALLGLWLTFESARFIRIRDHRAARRVLLTSYAVLMGIVVLAFLDKVGPL